MEIGRGSLETSGGSLELAVSEENLDDLFDAAGRVIGEGLHKAWWRSRMTPTRSVPEQAKLEIFGLAANPAVIADLQARAQGLTQDG